MKLSISNEPYLETQHPWGTERRDSYLSSLECKYNLETCGEVIPENYCLAHYHLELSKPPQAHTHAYKCALSLAPKLTPLHRHQPVTSPVARDINRFRTGLIVVPIARHKVPFDLLTAPLTAHTSLSAGSLCQPGSVRSTEMENKGAIKRQWPTSCFACASKQVI